MNHLPSFLIFSDLTISGNYVLLTFDIDSISAMAAGSGVLFDGLDLYQNKILFLEYRFFFKRRLVDIKLIWKPDLYLDQSSRDAASLLDLVGLGEEERLASPDLLTVHCWWICCRINRFQDWIILTTRFTFVHNMFKIFTFDIKVRRGY